MFKKIINIFKNVLPLFIIVALLSALPASAHEGFDEIRINAGGASYTDASGNVWDADNSYNTGNTNSTSNSISGTTDDLLYQSERWDPSASPELSYAVNVASGDYEVTLHFAEIYSGTMSVGARVFDVSLEGVKVLDNLDIYSEVGGNTALTKTFTTNVSDGTLNILFNHEVENPKISAIEIHQLSSTGPTPTPTPSPTPTPTPIPEPVAHLRVNTGGGSFIDTIGSVWDADNSYNTGNTYISSNSISATSDDALYQSERWDPASSPELAYTFAVENADYDVVLHFAEIYSGAMSTGARVFDVSLEGTKVLDNFDIYSEVGGNSALTKIFTTTVSDGALDILFTHEVENPKISAIEVIQKEVGEVDLAHAVAGEDQTLVDIDSSGQETATLDGSFSHTHAFGETLVSWEWSEGGVFLASGEIVNVNLAVGLHVITLTVTDSTGNTAEDEVDVEVLEENMVSGLAGYYYDYKDTSISTIPETTSFKPDWGVLETNLNFASTEGTFSTTPYSDHFAARFEGLLNISSEGTYGFALESNEGSRLTIDGEVVVDNDGVHGMTKVSASKFLTAGQHEIMVEYFENEAGAGLKFYWTPPGLAEEIVPGSVLTHHYAQQLPVVNFLDPSSGVLAGGYKVKLNGFGFIFDSFQTEVNWGATLLTGSQITKVDDKTIEIISPTGSEGEILVSATTPNGLSNAATYNYSDLNLPPVKFIKSTLFTGIDGPTSLAFGPDGKLYVGTQFGEVWIITLDDNFNVTTSYMTDIIQTSEATFRSILGIAFNPLDDPANPKVYVAHSNLFHGQTEDIYRGKISVLSGPSLSNKEDLISGLPVSDHDHGVNGMEVGMNGELYIQVGGHTNAGVPGELSGSGVLNEKKFSAATLVAHIQRDNFDGIITYDSLGVQTGGFDVEVFASGQRNPYDLVLHSNGNLYATDNGPNFGYGDKSVTCTTSGPDPEEPDELNLLVQGGYYGHANRFRGATDPRQCVWRSLNETSDAEYTAPLTTFPASTNGITEYWTNSFGGQLRGHLLASRWGGELFDVEISNGGLTVIKNEILEIDGGLDVTVHYTGSMFIAQNQNDKIILYKPDEPAQSGVYINSVSPFRGPINGGRELLVYGSGFDAGSAGVLVGGKECTINSATSTEIFCNLPAGDSAGAVDVTVSQSGDSFTLQNGFIYMNAVGEVSSPGEGAWLIKQNLPIQLGEVSSAVVNDVVYVFSGHNDQGNGNTSVFKYDPANDSWTSVANQTVVPAVDHAVAEVIGGKIYMFGGIKDDGSESNALAIYDPVSDSWTTGAPLTKDGSVFNVGSVSSAAIDGKLYIAGGIHNGATVTNTFVYDPGTNTWGELGPMPEGRNHAGGVGYNGKFYIFGGRCCGGNVVDNSFNDSFVYDPTTNSWSQLADMLSARGGVGTAVELNGELLVIGGEGGGLSNGTFPNVEGYDPATNIWRSLPDLPTPRHGIYPVNLNGKIHVVAGGMAQGFSVSSAHEVYDPNAEPEEEPSGIIRINSGGGSYVDGSGNTWSTDSFYNTGNTYSTGSSISGTADDVLYQSERWDPSASPELQYSITVPNGSYRVVLRFTEIYQGVFFVGGRVFDVSIEGVKVLDNLDIYSEVGGYAALTKTFDTSVADGTLNILFTHEVQNPKISAIEIIPL